MLGLEMEMHYVGVVGEVGDACEDEYVARPWYEVRDERYDEMKDFFHFLLRCLCKKLLEFPRK